jgi:hypothetical protein
MKKSVAAKGFVDDLNDAVRENPVSAALVGMGLLWLFFGGSKVSAFGANVGAVGSAARAGAGALGGSLGATGSAIGSAFSAAGSFAADVADQLGSGLSNGNAEKKDSQDAAATESAQSTGREFATLIQQNVAETFERQPLLVGAIGLAIGAGVASAFSVTQTESNIMGEAGVTVKESVQEFAGETAERLKTRTKRVLEEAAREAEVQGLTPAAAKDRLHGVVDKAAAVAESARDSINSRMARR